MTSANTIDTTPANRREPVAGHVKGACMFTLGAAIVVGVAVVTMLVVIAPDGPMMKTAVQGMLDHQHAIAVAYLK
jgi:hypothetical protein